LGTWMNFFIMKVYTNRRFMAYRQ